MSINEKSHAFDARRPSTTAPTTGSGAPALAILAVVLAVVLWIFYWVEAPAFMQIPDIIPYL
jgi:hypothetical protein